MGGVPEAFGSDAQNHLRWLFSHESLVLSEPSHLHKGTQFQPLVYVTLSHYPDLIPTDKGLNIDQQVLC